MYRRMILIFLLAMIIPGYVFADPGDPDPCAYLRNARPDLSQRAVTSAENAYQASVIAHKSKMDRVKDSATRLADCLSKYKNFQISSGLGLPDLGSALAAALNQLANMTCSAIDDAYNNTTALARKQVVLPGGIASGNVGLPTSWNLSQAPNPNAVSVPGGSVTVTNSNPTVFSTVTNSVGQQIKGIFK